jgi:hypothetical protein
MKYTFHNGGTVTSFTPNKKSGSSTLLDIHKELVTEAGRRDVYIMDHRGREVDCTATPVPQLRAA